MDKGICLVAENLCLVTKSGKGKRDLKKILDNVNLIAAPGRLLAIMGPSGSGKTSLLNIISGRSRNPLHDVKDPSHTIEIPAAGSANSVYRGVTVPAELANASGLKRAPVPYGKLYLNGKTVSYKELRLASRYVMQSDCLLPYLTVYETLRFAAQLKLTHFSSEKRTQMIDVVMHGLGLEVCRDVLIGDQVRKGISGGQRKRVSIGIELLEDPQVLFLDEPTSGLDSSLAFDVLKIVAKLVRRSRLPTENGQIRPRTVVCTIHQPRKQIFDMFDDLAILSLGRIVYHGPSATICDFWSHVGYPVPKRQNIADWSLDLLTATADKAQEVDAQNTTAHAGSFRHIVGRATSLVPVDPYTTSSSFVGWTEGEAPVSNRNSADDQHHLHTESATARADANMMMRTNVSEEVVRALPDRFNTSAWGQRLQSAVEIAKKPLGAADEVLTVGTKLTLKRSILNTFTLTHRMILNRARNVGGLVVDVAVCVLMTSFISCVFWQVSIPKDPNDCTGYFNVIGVTSFTGILQSFSPSRVWAQFPMQRPMINRERASRLYNPISSLCGMIAGDLPFMMISPVLHTLIIYWMTGIGPSRYFPYYFLFAFCVVWAASGWHIFAAMVAPSAPAASAIMPMGVIISILLCGLWITEDALPSFWNYVKYITFIRYGINSFLLRRFEDSEITRNCGSIPHSPGPVSNLLYLILIGIAWRIAAGFALAFAHTRQGLEA